NVEIQVNVLGSVAAVDEVVGIHDRANVGFFDGGFESGEINFAQGAFVDDSVGSVAIEFGIVGSEMFDGGADALSLHALDISDGNFSGEIRIFTHVFEIAAVHRGTVDIDGGPEHEIDALGASIAADFDTFARGEGGIPSGGERNAAGHGGGGAAIADAERTIGHLQAWPAEPGISAEEHIILAAD